MGRRVWVRELGETPLDGIDRCVLEEQAAPAPGPGEVVVAVRTASVGWVDLLMTSGQYQHMPPLPYTPGLEYAGVVAEVGAGVRGLCVGDAVMSDGLRTGPRSSGPHQADGGFATWATAPVDALMPIPSGFSFEEACNWLGNYETAWYALATMGQVGAGETVLVHGATGATGLAAVDVAKHLGATVIATGRSPEKLAIVAARGADHVVPLVGPPDGPVRFRDEVKALTGGRGVDVVYDGVGGEVSVETLRCVAFGARVLIVGWAATPAVARGKGLRGAPNANQLPTNLILMKGLRVLGCPTVIATEHDPSLRPPRLAALGALAAGGVRPLVAATWPLPDFHEAMRAKWQSRFVGGIVLRPPPALPAGADNG